MRPSNIERYENGEVAIDIHEFPDGDTKYWITMGAGSLYADWSDVVSMNELMNAIVEEETKPVSHPWLRRVAIVVLLVVVLMFAFGVGAAL